MLIIVIVLGMDAMLLMPAYAELPPLPMVREVEVAPSLAQSPGQPPANTAPEPPDLSPTLPSLELPLPPLPPPEEILRPSEAPSREAEEAAPEIPGEIVVDRFVVEGSTVFSPADLQTVTAPYTDRPLTFTELFAVRAAVTQLYQEAGYITSGAFIPVGQVVDDGTVTIQVIEGRLADINIEGLTRLNPNYVRRRVAIAAGPPLQVERLLAALQLLQQDPRIDRLTAELAAGPGVATSILNLTVVEAEPLAVRLFADNGQSPSIGSLRRGIGVSHLNLTGQGDTLDLTYSNTDGSNSVDVAYGFPFNALNGTVELAYSRGESRVIDEDFEILNLRTQSEEWSIGLRHPLYQTPTEELALGVRLTHEVSDRTFQPPGFERFGFPSLGAQDGVTRVSAIRFFQEWQRRGPDSFIGVRSQFNLGTDWLGATINPSPIPDSEFWSWQGQGQWVQRVAPETLIIGRIAGQLADRDLLSLEQFRLGGLGSVRGYGQDQTLSDNGLFASLEARVPLLRIPQWESTVQLTPFVEYGRAWNRGDRRVNAPAELLSVGAGLLWQVSDRASLRVDWGVPLLEPGPSEI
ncbi:MAG TPA: ShlB/FhaC/HecB family hemolysin secretion/activation protein, partial [Candidatus Obscuribacterales bacterium]